MSQGNQLAIEFGRQGHIISSRIFTEEDSFANTLIVDPLDIFCTSDLQNRKILYLSCLLS